MFHTNRKLSFTRIGKIAAICAGCYASMAQADATLVYETLDTAGTKTQHTFSITGRFVRIDTDPRKQPGYSLFDTGRMVMFNVDEKTHSYLPVKAGDFFHPAIQVKQPDSKEDSTAKKTVSSDTNVNKADPATVQTLKATKKKRTVSDKRCRVVIEMANDKQVAKHCMSGTGDLGLSDREVVTLSRLFTKADKLGLDLLGVATEDEKYVSIQSQRTDDKTSQTLKSVSKIAIPTEKMRIAEDYKLIKPAP